MNKMNIIYCFLVLLLNIRSIFNEIIEIDLDYNYKQLSLNCSNTYKFYLQISNDLVGELVFRTNFFYYYKNNIEVYEYSSRTNKNYIHNSTLLLNQYREFDNDYIYWKSSYIPKGESTTYIAFEFNPYIDIDLIEIKGVLDYLETEKTIANSQNFIGMYPSATKIYQIYFEARPGQIANIEIEFPEEDNDINNFDILNIYEYSTYARKVYNNKQNFLLNKKK